MGEKQRKQIHDKEDIPCLQKSLFLLFEWQSHKESESPLRNLQKQLLGIEDGCFFSPGSATATLAAGTCCSILSSASPRLFCRWRAARRRSRGRSRAARWRRARSAAAGRHRRRGPSSPRRRARCPMAVPSRSSWPARCGAPGRSASFSSHLHQPCLAASDCLRAASTRLA